MFAGILVFQVSHLPLLLTFSARILVISVEVGTCRWLMASATTVGCHSSVSRCPVRMIKWSWFFWVHFYRSELLQPLHEAYFRPCSKLRMTASRVLVSLWELGFSPSCCFWIAWSAWVLNYRCKHCTKWPPLPCDWFASGSSTRFLRCLTRTSNRLLSRFLMSFPQNLSVRLLLAHFFLCYRRSSLQVPA